MKDKNEIFELSFEFALEIIELYKFLVSENEYIMSKQLLRSGTSIGANINEAQAAQTKKDFISKMCIASKEARETHYWIELLRKSGYLDKYKQTELLLDHITSIIKLLTKIVKTSQSNMI